MEMVVSSFEMQGTHISQSGPQLDGKQHHTGDKGLVRTAPSQEGQPLWESSVVQSGSCSAACRAAQHRPVTKLRTKTQNRWTPTTPSEDTYRSRCHSRACRIVKDTTHPSHHLFTLLHSGRRCRDLKHSPTTVHKVTPPPAFLPPCHKKED